MRKQEEAPAVCVTRFRPVIAGSVIVVVAVLAWTALGRGRGQRPTAGGAVTAATAPPIAANARAPHPNFGHCSRCHDVLSPGGLVRGGAGLQRVAAAPPIAENARLAHPDWGPCGKCHRITKAGAKPAAFESGQWMIGARVQKLTTSVAERLEVEASKGLVVTEVLKGSPAGKGGLKVDDVILQVNNQAVGTVAALRQALAGIGPGRKVKLQVARGERKKNVFFQLPAQQPPAPPPGAMAATPGQLAAAVMPVPGRVAIAATGADGSAQVAPVFSGAPYFLLRDAGGGWAAIANPSPSGASRGQVAARLLAGQGVSAVIAGNVGPGAFGRLRDAGVQVYPGAFGSVDLVYRAFLDGRLLPATASLAGGARPAAAPLNRDGVVAIAAGAPDPRAPIGEDLAESPYLVMFDAGSRSFLAMANPAARGGGGGGGGVPLAQLLVDRGATAVVAGGVDPLTARALDELGLRRFAGVAGTVEDAAGAYLYGTLLQAPAAPRFARPGPM